MVEVLKTGLFDSIQDLGRAGVQHFGVPYSGAMDQYAAVLANSILGNATYLALLESTFQGPTLKFQNSTKICITGANANPKVNDLPIKMNTAITVNAGDILSFGKLEYGCRLYIAVLGGFQTEFVMHSRSMYPSITKSHRISKGDILPILEDCAMHHNTRTAVKTVESHFESTDIEVLKGPEFQLLDPDVRHKLLETSLTVANSSNRMAYQFEERLANDLDSMITSLVLPGTVQLTPSGQLIVLMRDCQTTGGYPRVLPLTEAAINRLAQKNFGKQIRFKLVN